MRTSAAASAGVVPAPRVLGPGDEAALEAFLARHAEASMFLRSNLAHAGLEDRGEPYQATYAALHPAGGPIEAVAAHAWNGVLLLQAPVAAGRVAAAAVRRSGRAVTGIVGPWAQAQAARRALGLAERPVQMDSREVLLALDLSGLRVPAPLASGPWRCRPAADDDLEPLVAWRAAYAREALGAADTPELLRASRCDVVRLRVDGSLWVLLDGGRRVASCGFNARLPDMMQVGGVYTPPELRGRGYARAAVAGALLAARAAGVRRAILFTNEGNAPALRAYGALGFAPVGDYAITLFAS